MSEVLAPWRSLLQKALHHNRSLVFSRYFQLATLTKQGLPTNRTVVFRGFQTATNNLLIITDSRSEKINHLQQQSQSEICWYFTKTREQFRISGKINIVFYNDKNSELMKLRQETWQQLSIKAKEQFTWANPGELIKENSVDNLVNFDLEKPLDNFCLLIFHPLKVDHLELKGNPPNRYVYFLDNDHNWQINQVNP